MKGKDKKKGNGRRSSAGSKRGGRGRREGPKERVQRTRGGENAQKERDERTTKQLEREREEWRARCGEQIERTWLEINRSVTIFHRLCPPACSPSLCSLLVAVHSAAECRENGRRRYQATGGWLCVHAAGKRSGPREDTPGCADEKALGKGQRRCSAWRKMGDGQKRGLKKASRAEGLGIEDSGTLECQRSRACGRFPHSFWTSTW